MTATLSVMFKGGGLLIVPLDMVYEVQVNKSIPGFGESTNQMKIHPYISFNRPTVSINNEVIIQTGVSNEVVGGMFIQHILQDPNKADFSNVGTENNEEEN